MEVDGDDRMERPLLRQPISERSAFSDQQLLHILSNRKASTRSSWQPTSSLSKPVIVKDVPSDQDFHPITILTVLGIDLWMTSQLELCYYFFSYSRYHRNTAMFTRDRQTKEGVHFWLQGGGKISIMDDNREESSQRAMIGWKKKFSFVGKSNRKRLPIMVGPNAYSFMLDELVLDEDEEEEKRMSFAGETPQSFLCVYRLYPMAHPCTKTKKDDYQEQGGELLASTELYNPEDWLSPKLIYIPGLEERYDLQSMRPFNKS